MGYYNPIVRTFGQLRAALVEVLELPREAIRPEMPLDVLLPTAKRRAAWEKLRRAGVELPGLELTHRFREITGWTVGAVTIAVGLLVRDWTALASGFELGMLGYKLTRPWAVHISLRPATVGELTMILTSFRDHRDSGYRWTRNEISFKVRQIVAESLHLAIDEVKERSTLAELGAE
jgi:hypothetical protein